MEDLNIGLLVKDPITVYSLECSDGQKFQAANRQKTQLKPKSFLSLC